MANKDLHYTSKRIYLGEGDVEVHKQGEYVDNDTNDGKPYILYDFWVEDIRKLLSLSFSMIFSERRRKALSLFVMSSSMK